MVARVRRTQKSGRDMFYHVLIVEKTPNLPPIHVINIEWDHLVQRVMTPYRKGDPITLHGRFVEATDIVQIRIIRTRHRLRKDYRLTRQTGYVYSRSEQNVTDVLIEGPPGYEAEREAASTFEIKTLTDAYDLLITVDEIRLASRKLFLNGHFENAVESVFKALESDVAKRCGASDYGASLMRKAFNGEPPLIALTKLETGPQKTVQEGYSHLFTGSMMAIRNPRAHGFAIDQPGEALELIMWAQHLMRTLHSATTLPTNTPEASG